MNVPKPRPDSGIRIRSRFDWVSFCSVVPTAAAAQLGKLTGVGNAVSTTGYVFDAAGRLVSSTQNALGVGAEQSFQYRYCGNDSMASITYPGNPGRVITNCPDGFGRPSRTGQSDQPWVSPRFWDTPNSDLAGSRVTYEVKPNSVRFGLIEMESLHGLLYVGSQFLPRVALRENALRQAFRAEAPIFFLHNFKDDFRIYTFGCT